MSEPRPIHDVRRRDRAVHDDAWIETMLTGAATGVLATVAEGQPFVNANLFVFDREARAVYFHTARQGRTRANVESAERVCFAVMELGRLLPAETALNFSAEYASVVAFGSGRVVQDLPEARLALQRILDKYFPDRRPGRDYRPITDEELQRTTVFRVDITEWSGKRKSVPADFPGARHYPPLSFLEEAP